MSKTNIETVPAAPSPDPAKALRQARKHYRMPVESSTRPPGDERDFATLYSRSQDAVLVVMPDSLRLSSGNEAACHLTGYGLAELKSQWLRELFPSADCEFVLDAIRQAANSESQTPPLPLLRKDGMLTYVNFQLLRRPLGRHNYWLLVLRDMAQARPLTEALMIRDLAMAACANGIAIADMRLPDQPLIYVNPAFERLTGYQAAEILGRNCRFLQGDERQQAARSRIRDAVNAGQEVHVILRNYRKDGTAFWNELHLSPVYNAGGEMSHMIGVQNDVTYKVEYYRQVLGEEPPGLA